MFFSICCVAAPTNSQHTMMLIVITIRGSGDAALIQLLLMDIKKKPSEDTRLVYCKV